MAKKVVIPWELKYDFAIRAYTSGYKGFLYAIREKCGAATTLEIFERVCAMDDRIKNLTNFFKTTFKLEGNHAETIGQWFDIWAELIGQEFTEPERSKTINRERITKCPFKTEPKDISDWCKIFAGIVNKTINPKATLERSKGMCAGDSYCEFVTRIEE